MNELNITVEVQKKKNKNGNEYVALVVDLGYRKAVLTFDRSLIAELYGMSIRELYESID